MLNIKKINQIIKMIDYKTIFDNATDGILVVNKETRKFILANNAMCKMLGYTMEEIKNLSVPDIHPKKDLPFVLEKFEKQARGEIILASNLPVKRKDGSVFFADVTTCPFIIGNKEYLAGSFRDMTEQKNNQELLARHAKDLEKMNALMMGRELRIKELKDKLAKLGFNESD